MKDGLKQKLNDWIKSEQGRVVSINAIEAQVKLWGYKISNYERRLRPSESPGIERIMQNGAIIGYRYLGASYNGNTTPSKSENRGSIPLAPAKLKPMTKFVRDWNSQFKKPVTEPIQKQPQQALNF